MKFVIKHLWSSLRDLATQSPILLALIAIFSCTPLYIEQDWFAEIDIKLYSLYFFIVILQSYITRARKFSILYTLVSIGISVGLYMIHKATAMCEVLNWLRKIYRTYGCTPWLPCISHRLVNTTSVKSLTASNGLASPLLRLRYITLLSSWVYGSSSSSWTNHSTLKKPFLRYSHPLICSFVYLWYVLTKRIPQVLQRQTHFYCCIRHHLA